MLYKLLVKPALERVELSCTWAIRLAGCSLEDFLEGRLIQCSIEQDLADGVDVVHVLGQEGFVDLVFNKTEVVESLKAVFEIGVGLFLHGLHVDILGALEDVGNG